MNIKILKSLSLIAINICNQAARSMLSIIITRALLGINNGSQWCR